MTTKECSVLSRLEDFARQKMEEEGLGSWGFRFTNTKCRLGRCCYTEEVIELSRLCLEKHGEAEARDTILHEIAHALTPGDGHGRKWRRQCIRLGCTPKATHRIEIKDADLSMYEYTYHCSECNEIVALGYRRRTAILRHHVSNCCRAKLTERKLK